MPWWIWAIAILAVAATVSMAVGLAHARAEGDRYLPQHALQDNGGLNGSSPANPQVYGSMNLDDELTYRTACFPPAAEWNRSNAGTDGGWEHRTALYNGHTWGCLIPDTNHLGACPEEGDWPNDQDVPYLPAAGPVDQGPDVLDAVLALEVEDPAAAGWTDQLLVDLREEPTCLDGVGGTVTMIATNDEPLSGPVPDSPPKGAGPLGFHERMADTGEIALAGLRAEFAAELRAQDDDAAEFISRQATAAAEFRLIANGL